MIEIIVAIFGAGLIGAGVMMMIMGVSGLIGMRKWGDKKEMK